MPGAGETKQVSVTIDGVPIEILAGTSLSLSTTLWTSAVFQFLNPIHRRYDSLDVRSACRKAATYTRDNTNTE
jgi:hypothetical protein